MKVMLAAIAVACLVAGCNEDDLPEPRVKLPHAPAYYVACFKKQVKIPDRDLTRAETVQLIASLKRSDLNKSECGRGVIAWYDSVVSAYGGR